MAALTVSPVSRHSCTTSRSRCPQPWPVKLQSSQHIMRLCFDMILIILLQVTVSVGALHQRNALQPPASGRLLQRLAQPCTLARQQQSRHLVSCSASGPQVRPCYRIGLCIASGCVVPRHMVPCKGASFRLTVVSYNRQVNVAAVQEQQTQAIDWDSTAKELDAKSPLEIMDHVSEHCVAAAKHASSLTTWLRLLCASRSTLACDLMARDGQGSWSAMLAQALKTFGDEIGIAWSGAEDVALVEYAHLTGRPYRVFRCGADACHAHAAR